MSRASPETDAICLECLNLLIVYYTYTVAISSYNSSTGTRFDMQRWWTTLRVLENDLIIRLCRLDDEGRSKHSLREALNSIRNKMPQNEASLITKKIKEYRQLINPLKTKARNYFLAHLIKDATPPMDSKGGLEEPIKEVIEIVDLITGELQKYTLSVGSQELPIDLKEGFAGAL